MDSILNIFLSGTFTLIGAIIGALISKYGIPFNGKRSCIKFEGSGNELKTLDTSGTANKILPKFSYAFKDGIIRITKKKVTGKCYIIITESGNTFASGMLRAYGPLHNGYAYLTYSVFDNSKKMFWKGICLLCIPGFGELSGYWMTEDRRQGCQFSIGKIILKRI